MQGGSGRNRREAAKCATGYIQTWALSTARLQAIAKIGVCFPGVSTSRVQHSLSSRFAFAQSVPLGPIVREHQGKPERRPPPLGSDRRIILTYPSPVLPPVSRPQ